MTRVSPRAAANNFVIANDPINPINGLLLFVLPVTAVLAGVFSIQGISPHAVTSGLVAVAGVVGLLTPRASVSPIARAVILATGAWALVTILHLTLRGIPINTEVAISLSGFAILFGVATLTTTRRTLRAFVWGWVVVYLLSIGAALAEKYFGYLPQNNYLVYQGGRSVEIMALSSFFGNPNGFALFLLASSIVFFPWMVSSASRMTRILFALLQFLTVYFMLTTNSRAGVTLLTVVLTVALWSFLSRRPMLRLMVVVLAAGLIAVVSLGSTNSALFDELGRLTLLSDSTVDDASFRVRYNLFLSGLAILAEHPLIGIGPNMFEQYMLSGRSPYPAMGIINRTVVRPSCSVSMGSSSSHSSSHCSSDFGSAHARRCVPLRTYVALSTRSVRPS